MSNYVSREQVDSKLSDIRGFCNSYIKKLEEIFEKVESIYYNDVAIKEFNNIDVEGSEREVGKILGVFGEGKKVKDVFVIPNNNIANCYDIISKEVDELIGRFNNILELLDSMSESMEMIAIYILKIEEALKNRDETISELDKYLLAKQLIERDKANGYELLHSTPVFEDYDKDKFGGVIVHYKDYNGKVLRFFNEYGAYTIFPLATFTSQGEWTEYTAEEIDKKSKYVIKCYGYMMDKTATFTNLHKQVLTNSLDVLLLEDNVDPDHWWKGESWGGSPGPETDTSKKFGNGGITVDLDWLLENCESPYYNDSDELYLFGYNRVVDSYVHETGHIFDAATGINYINDSGGRSSKNYSSLNDYSEFYDAVYSLKGSGIGIRSYAWNKKSEFFAELVGEYYGTNNSNYNYSSDDLKDLDVDLNGNTVNAYEIMDNILNKGSMY